MISPSIWEFFLPKPTISGHNGQLFSRRGRDGTRKPSTLRGISILMPKELETRFHGYCNEIIHFQQHDTVLP